MATVSEAPRMCNQAHKPIHWNVHDIPFELSIPAYHLYLLYGAIGFFVISAVVTVIAIKKESSWAGTVSVPVTAWSFISIFIALGLAQNPVPGPTVSDNMTAAIIAEVQDMYGVDLSEQQVDDFFLHLNYEAPQPGESQLYNSTTLAHDGAPSEVHLHWTGEEWKLEAATEDGYEELPRVTTSETHP